MKPERGLARATGAALSPLVTSEVLAIVAGPVMEAFGSFPVGGLSRDLAAGAARS